MVHKEHQRISYIECEDLIRRTRRLANDSAIPSLGPAYSTLLSSYKRNAYSILAFLGVHRYITKKQKDLLERICTGYQKIVELNESYDTSFRQETADFFREVAHFVEPYVHIKTNVQQRRKVLFQLEKKIRRGEYFWDIHIKSGGSLLDMLQADGVDIGDLERKMHFLLEKTKLEYEL